MRTGTPGSDQLSKVVLSVEDDDATFSLICYSFQDIGGGIDVRRAVDGEDALEFLHRRGKHKDAPKPRLILLNLNLPKLSGPELLALIRADDGLRDIPAVVFSTSKLDADRARCVAVGATDFITKPNSYRDFVNAVRSACGHVVRD